MLPIMVLSVQDARGREIKQLSAVTPRANDGADPGVIVVTVTLYCFLVVITSPSPSSFGIHFRFPARAHSQLHWNLAQPTSGPTTAPRSPGHATSHHGRHSLGINQIRKSPTYQSSHSSQFYHNRRVHAAHMGGSSDHHSTVYDRQDMEAT